MVVLELLIFHDYFSGRSIVGWDFLSHYNTEAFAWWRDGTFFSPPQWMPYMWGGYPATLDLQNSSWYLPVGLMSAVTTFDLHASAILSALHVGFGSVGMYVLGRRWRLPHVAALLGLVIWFFASGFYAHASHLDIMRGYAWIPWVLLCVSPQWAWKRWWGPPLAGLVIWQAILAMYPGALVASVYAFLVWVLLVQLTLRPRIRDYIAPIAAATTLAILMTLLRFLPFALVRGLGTPSAGDTSIFSWRLIGTLLYAYGDPRLPNDITMRSFFLPVVALVLVGFVAWRHPLARIAAGTTAASIALGFPGSPWSPLVESLPGLHLSRFKMDDFKLMLLASICILAMLGAARCAKGVPAGEAHTRSILGHIGPWRAAYIAIVVIAAAAVGASGPFGRYAWLGQWALVVCAATITWATAARSRTSATRAVTGLILVAACSGLLAVMTTTIPWHVDRVSTERAFGSPVDTLVAQRPEQPLHTTQRPARVGPGSAISEAGMLDTRWARVFYTGGLSVAGYANLKGAETFETIHSELLDPVTAADAAAFWSAPGIAVTSSRELGGLPLHDVVLRCVRTAQCGEGVQVTPVAYTPATPMTYDVVSQADTTVSFNEAFYPGWQAEVCTDKSSCSAATPLRGRAGEVRLDVPRGRSTVTLRYILPGLTAAWLAFATGLAGLFVWPAIRAVMTFTSDKAHSGRSKPTEAHDVHLAARVTASEAS
ncbi:hypothetical protein DDP54_02760 [Cellulomonas sp. WB94]|nr:hypothetical protein DDP54_02760 [Cellulomonas sp. WB94]